jgi:hypothetical protein
MTKSKKRKARTQAKEIVAWATDMRARAVVVGWLMRMGKTAPDRGLRHTEFALKLQAILEPKRIEPRFKTKKEAARYVREIAKAVDGRDILDAPPRWSPLHAQKIAAAKRQERQQRVFDGKRKAAQHRIEAKIAAADQKQAEHMAERRAESERHACHNDRGS